MTLFEQWELINYIANKDYEGNIITPDQFGALVKIVNLDLFKVKMGLPEDWQIGVPVSRQYLDANQIMTDETKFLKKYLPTQTVATGVIAYPVDYFSISAMRFVYTATIDNEATAVPKTVEELTEDEYSDRAGNFTKKPTTENPVCVIRSDGIYVFPTSITSVQFAYIKYPVEPVFAYTQGAGFITEGASPTEYEWPKILHMDLTRMILGYVGINLRETQLQQYAEIHKGAGV